MNNKPVVIGVTVAVVLLAVIIIWKTVFADPYGTPPPIQAGGAGGGKSMSAPAGDKPGTGGLSMPSTPPGAGGPSSPGAGMTLPTPPK